MFHKKEQQLFEGTDGAETYEDFGVSPAQLLKEGWHNFSRTFKTSDRYQLSEAVIGVTSKETFGHGTKLLQKLKVGDGVRFWKNGTWDPTWVITVAEQPRSYIVETYEGTVVQKEP